MKKVFRISTVPMSLNLLLRGQLKYLNQYYDITAISGAGKDMDEVREREGVKTKIIEIERQISPLKDIISLVKLYKYFKKEKPEIIHSITPKAGLLSMLAGKLAGVPVRMHTFTGLIFPHRDGFSQDLLVFTDRVLCLCATHLYPEGEGVKKDLERFKITTKPLNIIAHGNVNGIDINYFKKEKISLEQKENLKRNLGVSDNDFVYIFVGRLVKDKGINELVKAFTQLQKVNSATNQKNIKLILVGTYEQNLNPLSKETIKEIEHNSDIIFAGYHDDIRPYLSVSDVLVFPSYREGFPNVVLQALSMELPAIVTNISGCNEIVEHQINGLIIPPKNTQDLTNALQKILNDSELYKNLKGQTRNSVKDKYDNQLVWDAQLKEYLNLSK